MNSKLNPFHILLDFGVILYIFFGTNLLTNFARNHLVAMFYIVALLHITALGFVLFDKVRSDNSSSLVGGDEESWLGKIQGLIFVLALGSSFWLIFPGVAISDIIGRELPGLGILIIGMIFAVWIILGIAMSGDGQGWKTPLQKMLFENIFPALFVFLFFICAETLILAVSNSQTISIDDLGFGAIMLLISYLPLRLMLTTKPPIKNIEFFSVLITVSILIYKMFI
ncbi:hypothetical protein C0581_00275 [Candidatus Parcubacteria bacterium]|nr:MAG: hypothetical protein C0581_00275 [Candidatus Parcubacteria bacterium]